MEVKRKISTALDHAPDLEFLAFGIQRDPVSKRYGVYVMKIKNRAVLESELFDGQTEEEHQFIEDSLMRALAHHGAIKS